MICQAINNPTHEDGPPEGDCDDDDDDGFDYDHDDADDDLEEENSSRRVH